MAADGVCWAGGQEDRKPPLKPQKGQGRRGRDGRDRGKAPHTGGGGAPGTGRRRGLQGHSQSSALESSAGGIRGNWLPKAEGCLRHNQLDSSPPAGRNPGVRRGDSSTRNQPTDRPKGPSHPAAVRHSSLSRGRPRGHPDHRASLPLAPPPTKGTSKYFPLGLQMNPHPKVSKPLAFVRSLLSTGTRTWSVLSVTKSPGPRTAPPLGNAHGSPSSRLSLQKGEGAGPFRVSASSSSPWAHPTDAQQAD